MFDLPAHRHYAETRLRASFEPCEERDMAVMLFDACEAIEALQAEVERAETRAHDAYQDAFSARKSLERSQAENARLRKALETWASWWNNVGREHYRFYIVPPITQTAAALAAPQTGGDDV